MTFFPTRRVPNAQSHATYFCRMRLCIKNPRLVNSWDFCNILKNRAKLYWRPKRLTAQYNIMRTADFIRREYNITIHSARYLQLFILNIKE